eukprot:gnl/TRDRNA2_/TRDRNA2_81992_c0_seq1.p1 gnl/TRDRNA2_/TRDRNA2_81992_c0~~gnl/TRDRNA2_/TRDRNA2_81992_c0_seq1.p1  ORF type:complete len:651 (+),score=90.69 gnl/TRDRNA2_/TRDRNA2_81992_c0_seq1:50-1954(+)
MDDLLFLPEVWEAFRSVQPGCSLVCVVDAPHGRWCLDLPLALSAQSARPPVAPVEERFKTTDGLRFLPRRTLLDGVSCPNVTGGLAPGVSAFVLAACDNHSVAHEVPEGFTPGPSGLLTASLCEVVASFAGRPCTVLRLFELVRQRMLEKLEEMGEKADCQRPVLAYGHECAPEATFFLRHRTSPASPNTPSCTPPRPVDLPAEAFAEGGRPLVRPPPKAFEAAVAARPSSPVSPQLRARAALPSGYPGTPGAAVAGALRHNLPATQAQEWGATQGAMPMTTVTPQRTVLVAALRATTVRGARTTSPMRGTWQNDRPYEFGFRAGDRPPPPPTTTTTVTVAPPPMYTDEATYSAAAPPSPRGLDRSMPVHLVEPVRNEDIGRSWRPPPSPHLTPRSTIREAPGSVTPRSGTPAPIIPGTPRTLVRGVLTPAHGSPRGAGTPVAGGAAIVRVSPRQAVIGTGGPGRVTGGVSVVPPPSSRRPVNTAPAPQPASRGGTVTSPATTPRVPAAPMHLAVEGAHERAGPRRASPVVTTGAGKVPNMSETAAAREDFAMVLESPSSPGDIGRKLLDEDSWYWHLEDRRRGGAPPDCMAPSARPVPPVPSKPVQVVPPGAHLPGTASPRGIAPHVQCFVPL